MSNVGTTAVADGGSSGGGAAGPRLVIMPALKRGLNSWGSLGSPGARTPTSEDGQSKLLRGRLRTGAQTTRLARAPVTRRELLTSKDRAQSDNTHIKSLLVDSDEELEKLSKNNSSSTVSSTHFMETAKAPAPASSLSDEGTVLAKAAVEYCEAFPVGSEQLHPSRFAKLKLLGRGAVGEVYLVRLLPREASGEDNEVESDLEEETEPMLYAMKVVSKEDMIQKNKIRRVLTEREVLASCAHPYIVAMYASFQTSSKLYYCMEHMAGGEFFRMLQQQKDHRVSEDVARFYAAEVILAIEYLHRMGFVYRDLKPENVLMRGDGHIALADFDLSKQAVTVQPKLVGRKLSLTERLKGSLALKKTNSKLNMLELVAPEPVLAGDSKSFVGTAEYIAPEVVSGVSQTPAVDWWTLGVLIYEMIFGSTPFQGEDADETFENITKQEIRFPSDVPVSRECKDLIRRLLNRDPKARLGAQFGATQIKEHKWFAGINFALIRNNDAPILPSVCKVTTAKLNSTQTTLADLDSSTSSAVTSTNNSTSSCSPDSSADCPFAGFDCRRYGSHGSYVVA